MVPIAWKDDVGNSKGQPFAVTCFGFNQTTKLLYTGDESGLIKVWPLGPLMQQAAQNHELVKISKKTIKNTTVLPVGCDSPTTPKKVSVLLPPINNNLIESPTASSHSSSTILPEYLRLSNSRLNDTFTSPFKLAGLNGAPTNPNSNSKKMNKSASLPAISFKNDGGISEKSNEHKSKSQNLNPNNCEARPITDLGFFEESRKIYNTPIISVKSPEQVKPSPLAIIEEIHVNKAEDLENEFDILTTDRDIMFPNYKVVSSHSFQAHQDSVTGLQIIENAITPSLMSYGFDGSIELWSLDKNKHIASLLTIVNRNTASKTKEEVLINNPISWEFYPDIKTHAKYVYLIYYFLYLK